MSKLITSKFDGFYMVNGREYFVTIDGDYWRVNGEWYDLSEPTEYDRIKDIYDYLRNLVNDMSPVVVETQITKQEEIGKEEIKSPFKFDTNQKSIVIPTGELIKQKDTDFRVMLGISGLSNCDDVDKKGDNTRYTSLPKVDRNSKDLCETIGIDISNFNKKLRTIIKKKSDEFKVVEKEVNGHKVSCYEMNYKAGEFITIPKDKAERCLVSLGNNPIKLYCNLLWLCQDNGKFIKKHIPQSTLATLMGLSPRSENIVLASMQTLVNQDLIKVTKVTERTTEINSEGLPVTKSVSKYYYEIIVENENYRRM